MLRSKAFVLFIVLAISLAATSCFTPVIPTPYVAEEFPICTDSAWQADAAISGDIVMWNDQRNGNRDIYGYNLATDTEFPICIDPSDQIDPAISGDIVVWFDWRNSQEQRNIDIYGCNLSTGTEFPICTKSASQVSPAISGDIVGVEG